MVEAAPQARPGSRLAVLDGYRAVAILLVLGFHYGVRWAPPWSKDVYLPYHGLFAHLWPLKYGRSHACFFFILSGFVILLTLERCSNLVDFWRKRLARLWPALILCAGLTTLALALWGPAEWRKDPLSFLLSILMTDPDLFQKLVPNIDVDWIDGAYWTLAAEARFYIWVGLIFLLPRRVFLPAWLGLQLLSACLAPPAMDAVKALVPARMVLMPDYMPYFTLGICLFEIFRSGRWSGLPVYGALFGVLMIGLNAAGWSSFAFEDPKGRLVVNAFWIGMSVLFVLKSPLVRPLAWAPLAKLGEASYALFLLHEAAGISLMGMLDRLGVHPLVNLALVVAGMIGMSLLIHRFVEEPARKLILGWTNGLVAQVSRRAPWLNYPRPLTQPRAV